MHTKLTKNTQSGTTETGEKGHAKTASLVRKFCTFDSPDGSPLASPKTGYPVGMCRGSKPMPENRTLSGKPGDSVITPYSFRNHAQPGDPCIRSMEETEINTEIETSMENQMPGQAREGIEIPPYHPRHHRIDPPRKRPGPDSPPPGAFAYLAKNACHFKLFSPPPLSLNRVPPPPCKTCPPEPGIQNDGQPPVNSASFTLPR